MVQPQLYSQKLSYLKNSDEITKQVILITGFIVTLWTDCIFLSGYYSKGIMDTDKLIVYTTTTSHIIFSLATTNGAYHGLKKSLPEFLVPWFCLKTVEGTFLTVGIIFCATHLNSIGLIGILILMICIYITSSLYNSYKKMLKPCQDEAENIMQENPPAYEEV